MLQGEVNRQPIQLLVNYWEIPPTRIGTRLDELLRYGVTHLVSFIPWQAVESDITHSLSRFLQALAARKMTVSLIVTPEVGVHYPNSGLPKDLFSKPENTARNYQNGTMPVGLAPNIFNLPSLLSPEFLKRYHGFLLRLDQFFSDLIRTEPKIFDGVTAVLTGSYWKYYRCHKEAALNTFSAIAGDYSGLAGVAFRQFLDFYYAQKEFKDTHPSVANRWKSQSLEDLNRRLFYQYSENLFRSRSTQYLLRKALPMNVLQFELFSPEADPAFGYSNFIHSLTGARADFNRLSLLLDETASKSSTQGEHPTFPYVHWSGLGPFSSLNDSEKQFLFLKSLLLFGGRGGGIIIDEAEWFSFSQPFKARVESLSRQMTQGTLRLKPKAYFLTPHLWADGGDLWDELFRRVGPRVQMVSTLDVMILGQEPQLVVVDPTFVMTKEVVLKLMSCAHRGGVVAIPRSPFYSESSRAEVERHLMRNESIEINLGIPYRIQREGEGRVILYDLPNRDLTSMEVTGLWETFLKSVLSVAGISPLCQMTDDRLKMIPFEMAHEKEKGLFILNGGVRGVNATLHFAEDSLISDLALSLSGKNSHSTLSSELSRRFTLEAPPYGILSLKVESVKANKTHASREENAPLWS